MNNSHTYRTNTRTGSAAARRTSRGVRDQRRNLIEVGVLLLIVVLLIAGAVTTSRPRAVSVTSSRVQVQAGDTLWTLAAKHPIPGLDTARTADEIARLNGMKTAQVSPGDSILVPSQAAPSVAMASR